MNSKGQGVSINVIIVAAIALVVLIVLIAIFTGRIGSFSQGVETTVDRPFGSQFGADCHPDSGLVQSYNTQKDVLQSEIASLEAQGIGTSSVQGQLDRLTQDYSRLEASCAGISRQADCSISVSRGELDGQCRWK